MVNVTDGADVAVRLVTLKFGLGHRLLSVSRLATDVLKSDPMLNQNWVLPAVMAESLVGFGHPMRIFALLHGGAAIIHGIQQLVG